MEVIEVGLGNYEAGEGKNIQTQHTLNDDRCSAGGEHEG